MPEELDNLQRCLSCRHARDRNPEKGTLTCEKHAMLIDNEADEIPDDCVEFEEAEGRGAEGQERKDGK